MTKIYRLDGSVYDLDSIGIQTKSFDVSSPPPRHVTVEIEGVNGVIDYGTTDGPKTINASFRFAAKDNIDQALLRDEIFSIFKTKEKFYISDPLTAGKRWLVKTNNSYNVERSYIYGDFEVEFIAFYPYAESIGTTQDIQRNGIDADSGLWGFGMGLIAEDESLIYTHQMEAGKVYKIYNAGNVEVHPFEQDLKITISDIQGSGKFFELQNQANGDVFRVNESVHSGNTIVLDGPNITSNSLAYLRKTNRQFISLVPGWNYFMIEGASGAKVSWDFRFYYK